MDVALGNGTSRLSPTDRATHDELLRLDPQLAGLFRAAHQIARRPIADGEIFLLAHAGRELSRGVVRSLVADDAFLLVLESEDFAETSKNRGTIGAILNLPSDHAAVSTWFRANQTFSRSCHYRVPVPDHEEVVQAFHQLSEFLYGRIAPYFATHAELDAFLLVERPTSLQVERAAALLARPQQRRHFYSNLSHAAWVAPLAERGLFSTPPDRVVHDNGEWEMRSWPEGDFLARLAAGAPEVVTAQFAGISMGITNPPVWRSVAVAAIALPLPQAEQLAIRLATALKTTPAILLADKIIDLIARLASLGSQEAFRLAETMLWTKDARDVHQYRGPASKFGISEPLLVHCIFARMHSHDFDSFRDRALPELERLDLERTFRILVRCLDRIEGLVASAENEGDRAYDASHFWCESLASDTDEEDARSLLAKSIATVAIRLAQRDEEGARSAWGTLDKCRGDLFRRLRFYLLAKVGPRLQQQLDAVIGSSLLLDPTSEGHEVAMLLREQFGAASPEARMLFRYALERGPDIQELRESAEFRRMKESVEVAPQTSPACPPQNEEPEPPSLTRELVDLELRSWQRRRLRWFHARIPDDLSDVAARAGVAPGVPSPEQQGLDEVGHYGTGVTWASGPQSPKDVDELSGMSAQEIVALLRDWIPDRAYPTAFSFRGLESALGSFAEVEVERAIDALRIGAHTGVRACYFGALLAGIRSAVKAGKSADWGTLLATAEQLLQLADSAVSADRAGSGSVSNPDQSSEVSDWCQVGRGVAELLQACCANDRLPHLLSDQLWSLVERLIHSNVIWIRGASIGGDLGFGRVIAEASNSPSGAATEALVGAGLWEYRATAKSAGIGSSERPALSAVVDRISPLLTAVLSREGDAALGSKVVLGQFVPQLLLLAPAWFKAAEDSLFLGGAEDPFGRPIWGAYAVLAPCYGDVFRRLRPWYLRAAQATHKPLPSETTRHREWSVTQGLISHVLLAVLRGQAAIGQGDRIVESTFEHVPASERAHAYWNVFRSWSDHPRPPSRQAIERLVRLWEWRLMELEQASRTADRDTESEGLFWLLRIPSLPIDSSIRLGVRTVRLSPTGDRATAGIWNRVGHLSSEQADAAFPLVELLIDRELTRPYPHIPEDEIAPLLRNTLNSRDLDIRTRTERMVHRLGERGHFGFGRLVAP